MYSCKFYNLVVECTTDTQPRPNNRWLVRPDPSPGKQCKGLAGLEEELQRREHLPLHPCAAPAPQNMLQGYAQRIRRGAVADSDTDTDVSVDGVAEDDRLRVLLFLVAAGGLFGPETLVGTWLRELSRTIERWAELGSSRDSNSDDGGHPSESDPGTAASDRIGQLALARVFAEAAGAGPAEAAQGLGGRPGGRLSRGEASGPLPPAEQLAAVGLSGLLQDKAAALAAAGVDWLARPPPAPAPPPLPELGGPPLVVVRWLSRLPGWAGLLSVLSDSEQAAAGRVMGRTGMLRPTVLALLLAEVAAELELGPGLSPAPPPVLAPPPPPRRSVRSADGNEDGEAEGGQEEPVSIPRPSLPRAAAGGGQDRSRAEPPVTPERAWTRGGGGGPVRSVSSVQYAAAQEAVAAHAADQLAVLLATPPQAPPRTPSGQEPPASQPQPPPLPLRELELSKRRCSLEFLRTVCVCVTGSLRAWVVTHSIGNLSAFSQGPIGLLSWPRATTRCCRPGSARWNAKALPLRQSNGHRTTDCTNSLCCGRESIGIVHIGSWTLS